MRRRTKVLVAAGATVVFAAGAFALASPWYVKRTLVEQAAARHVTLAIDGVSLRPWSITLSDVTATSFDVPGASVTSANVSVELDGLRPANVDVGGAKIVLDGDVQVLLPALDRLARAQPEPASGGGGAPPRIRLKNAEIEWKRASGASSVVRIEGLTGEVRGAPLGAEMDLAGVFSLDVGASKFGPWPTSHVRDNKTVTTKVVLSAKDADRAHAHFSHAADGSSSALELVVATPTRLVDLGFPSSLLAGFALDHAVVTVDLKHEETAAHAKGAVRALTVQGVTLRGAAVPLALAVTGLAYDGPRERMPVTSGTLTAGPFSGPVTGALGRPPGGLTLDLGSTSAAISCADALRAQTKAVTGPDVAAGLEALAHLFGADRGLAGDVTLQAELALDTRDLGAARVRLTPSMRCDLSFLPR